MRFKVYPLRVWWYRLGSGLLEDWTYLPLAVFLQSKERQMNGIWNIKNNPNKWFDHRNMRDRLYRFRKVFFGQINYSQEFFRTMLAKSWVFIITDFYICCSYLIIGPVIVFFVGRIFFLSNSICSNFSEIKYIEIHSPKKRVTTP